MAHTLASTSDAQRSHHPAPIFRLPIELRQQIYSYLLPRENVSYPLPSVGITSVSHRPPSTALLDIHPVLTREILDYFYTLATWKLILSHAFNFFRIDPELRNLAASPSLAHMRSVEVVFFCDIVLMREYPSCGIKGFCAEVRRRATRAFEVLRLAPRLQSVTVSWIDTAEMGAWQVRGELLAALRCLTEPRVPGQGPISFRVGEVLGPDGLDQEMVVNAIHDVLGRGYAVDIRVDGTAEEHRSFEYRVLAFDARQRRHHISTQPGSLPRPNTYRSGWRGAPPLLDVLRE